MPKKHPKILLAEDDKLICRAYEASLKQEGYEVITACDGNEALEKFASEKPNLVLLDLIMPNKNGFEVLETIKANGDAFKTPIIILSNLGQKADVGRAKDLGAVDYLIKSDMSIQQIIEKVKKYLR